MHGAFFYFRQMNLEALKYPIGPLRLPQEISMEQVEEAVKVLQIFPEQLKQLCYHLTDEVLDTPYRPEGWTIRQLIHHIADSHHHSYNRFRWALTEDKPKIKAYDQEAFAAMDDYNTAPIAWSINHIQAVHQKLVFLLSGLTQEQWSRSFIHPEGDVEVNLKQLALTYSWHSMHHFMHIKNALDKL